MDIDIKNIETLLSEKKYDQVRSVINAAATNKFSDEENGAALVGLASVYLDISNAINTRYKDALQEIISGMQEVNAAEVKVSEIIKLAEVRDKLSK